ncbi:low affinity immunoglobulin gamma Fc region receptor III-B-like isoform X2 [Suricata suricatta]|uniref:Low affinity immunoglobulin gamma Fc region receptor III-A n=1 Tax=Suricata suricatta TaxID=37032 RepID=A0A673U6G4_SURSU|nr:low affinity immunoglobulin gamma Fc region receptor III-B-like isoform X2 [Suricata suricatta]
MWQLLSPMILFLLVSAGPRAERPKAMVVLEPEWTRILTWDRVTLRCQGPYGPGDPPTQWWHNGSLISHQASSYDITAARLEDSGEYKCQTNLSKASDPVQLEVHATWLLLQAPRWVFQEGETIRLRCHSWQNKKVWKVQYFQDGRGKRFFHSNSEFHIPKATRKHSGSYFCRGIIGTKNESSEAVDITVQGPPIPSTSTLLPHWYQIAFFLVLVLLYAVVTGLFLVVQRDLRRSMETGKDRKVTWSRDPQDKLEQ